MFKQLKSLLGGKPSAPEAPPATPATPEAGDDDLLVNAYCTVRQLPPINFPHRLNSVRDHSDAELSKHLDGFIGYVRSRGDGQMTRVRYHCLRHIQRVQQQASLWVAPAHMDDYAAWAAQANAITFLPDGGLRDPQGNVLIDAAGGGEAQAQVPYPADAWERKARSDAELARLGVRVIASLPPVISVPEVQLRSAAEVAGRALALFAVALRGESLADNDGAIPVEDLKARLAPAFDYLSPAEQAFLAIEAPDAQAIAQFTWRYEALLVLLWALGLVYPDQPSLPPASAICDVPLIARTVMEADRQALVTSAKLRPAAEIIDALDLHYRLHWAVVQARVDKIAAPAGTEPGVVLERHYALNWLVRFEEADWDEVDTPT